MSTTVGRLTIDMVANVARLQRDMEQAKKSVGTAMGSIQKSVDLAKKALIGLGGVLAVKKFASFIQGAIDSADQMSKLSQRIGVSVKDVAGLELAFRQSGLQAGALQQSMARLSQGIANGNRALEAMGVQTRNVDGTLKDTRQVLGEVATQFSRYEDGAAKSALAMELFGRSGADLIPLLNGGAEALDGFDQMAQKLGLTLDKETAQQAERFNDTLDLVRASAQGMTRQVAAQLLPTLESMAEAFFNVASETNILQYVAKAIQVVFQSLVVVGSEVAFVLVQIAKGFVALKNATGEALRGNFKAAREVFAEYNRQANESREALDRFQATVMGTGSATVAAYTQMSRAARNAAPAIAQVEERVKRQAEAQRIMNRELDEYFKAEEKARLEKERSIGAAREMVEQIEFETAALKMTNTEREIAIRLRELERRGIREGSREYEEFSKRIREAVIGREAVAASIEQQRKAQASWDKTWEQVAQSFTDALMQGGKSVKEYLTSLFRTIILRPLIQPIIGIGATMMGGVANAMGFGPAGTGAGGTMNVLTMAKGAYDAIAGGFTAIGNSVAFAADTMGAWLVNNTSGVLNQMGGSLMQSAGALGTAASYFAGAASGMAIGSIISGQFAAFGNANVATGVGTAIGAMIGGPIGAAIGGTIGGIVNRAFGMGSARVTNQGIGGYISPMGTMTQQNIMAFADVSQKGGWFRSDKHWREWTNLSMEVINQFNVAARGVFDSARNMGQALGQIPASLAGFVFYFESSGNDIEKVMSNFADRLTRTLFPAIAGFVREGETAYDALLRLATAASTFNQVFDTLGHTMRANTLATADAAERLITLFGGTEQFVQATSNYYREFYTEAERAATTTRQLTEVLGTMGLKLPANRQAFRDLVEAQDLTTEAGRQTYAALLNLAPAFASISASMEQLEQVSGDLNDGLLLSAAVLRERDSLERQLLTLQGDTVELRRRELAAVDESNRAILERIFALQDEQEAMRLASATTDFAMEAVRRAIDAQIELLRSTFAATDAAFSRLQRSVAAASQAAEQSITRTYEALNQALNTQLNAARAARTVAQENVSALQSVFDVLKSNIASLMGEVLPQMTAAQGRAFITQALVTAQTTGYLPEREQLTAAIGAARSGLTPDAFASSFEMRREQLRLVAELQGLQDLTGTQLTTAERQLQAADNQIVLLERRIEQAKVQFDADLAQNRAYYDAILERAQSQVDALRGVDTSVVGVQTAIGMLQTAIRAEEIAQIEIAKLEEQLNASQLQLNALRGIDNSVKSVGSAIARLTNAMVAEASAQRALAALGGAPAFASGGMHMGGLRMVGEGGPELEVTGPARYFSASQTASMMGGGAEVAGELRNLREENKAQARALVGLQSRMTRLLERWDGDGLPEERTVSA